MVILKKSETRSHTSLLRSPEPTTLVCTRVNNDAPRGEEGKETVGMCYWEFLKLFAF